MTKVVPWQNSVAHRMRCGIPDYDWGAAIREPGMAIERLNIDGKELDPDDVSFAGRGMAVNPETVSFCLGLFRDHCADKHGLNPDTSKEPGLQTACFYLDLDRGMLTVRMDRDGFEFDIPTGCYTG